MADEAPTDDLPTVLRQYHDKVARLENVNACLQRDYERAQKRTFELSERIQQVEAEAVPLRDLLRRVAVHCLPNFYEMRGDGMDQVWQDVRKATR